MGTLRSVYALGADSPIKFTYPCGIEVGDIYTDGLRREQRIEYFETPLHQFFVVGIVGKINRIKQMDTVAGVRRDGRIEPQLLHELKHPVPKPFSLVQLFVSGCRSARSLGVKVNHEPVISIDVIITCCRPLFKTVVLLPVITGIQ